MKIDYDDDVTIWKYELLVEDRVTIRMPFGADVLCVQMQGDKPYLWAKVNKTFSLCNRVFYVIGTGNPMPVNAKEYVGTFQMMHGGLVFHVFEA